MLVLTSPPRVVDVVASVMQPGLPSCARPWPSLASQPILLASARGECMLMWFWSHLPCPLQPAVVHALPSLSAHGVLFSANRCVCTHTPSSGLVPLTSQPAVVQVLPSVSVHGVLACGVHCPLVVSQPWLHSSAGGQTLPLWFWSHTPCPSHPAVVHALPSLSAHGVLFSANRCVCTHTPRPVLSSQPAVVHVLPSVSAHGVLASAACPVPVVVSHPRLHSSTVQLGQMKTPLDWLTADAPPLSHSASACPLLSTVEKPATTSTFCVVSSEFGPELGSRLSSFTLKEMKQLLSLGMALVS